MNQQQPPSPPIAQYVKNWNVSNDKRSTMKKFNQQQKNVGPTTKKREILTSSSSSSLLSSSTLPLSLSSSLSSSSFSKLSSKSSSSTLSTSFTSSSSSLSSSDTNNNNNDEQIQISDRDRRKSNFDKSFLTPRQKRKISKRNANPLNEIKTASALAPSSPRRELENENQFYQKSSFSWNNNDNNNSSSSSLSMSSSSSLLSTYSSSFKNQLEQKHRTNLQTTKMRIYQNQNLKLNENHPKISYLQSAPSKSYSSSNNEHQHSSNNFIIAPEVVDSNPTVMELECVAGYDGGLTQHFILEAYDSKSNKLRLNITSSFSDIPLFRIDLSGEFFLFFLGLGD